MANLITALAIAGCRKSDGTPAASGFVFLYSPGTTTLVSGYTSDALTQTWPTTGGGIQLDAGGRANIWVAGRVDVVVTDASGTVVSSMLGFNGTTANAVEVQNAGFTGAITDPATGNVTQGAGGLTDLDTVLSSLTSSVGGTDGQYLESVGATPRKLQIIIRSLLITPEDFGAGGTGVTDDTVAVQKMLTELARLGRGRGYLAGTYKISSLLTLPANVSGILLEGNGPSASVINQVTGSTDCLSIGSGSSSCALRGLSFTGGGVLWNAALRPLVDYVTVGGGTNGMAFTGTNSSDIRVLNSELQGTVNGLLLTNCSRSSVVNSTVKTTGGGGDQAFQFTGTTNGFFASNCHLSGTTGATWANGISGTQFTFADCPNLGDGTFGSTPFNTGTLVSDPIITQRGNLYDDITQTLTTGAPLNVFPNSFAPTSTLKVTSGSGSILVKPPALTPLLDGKRMDIVFLNMSGSNFSWTFDAIYALTAGVDGTNGARTNLGLRYDIANTKWREIYRAETT